MCSEFFGCDYDAVAVHAGSTTFSPLNTAAFASRTVIAAAGALLEACARLRAKTLRIAAHALEVDDPDALDIVGSAVQHRRDPTLVIPLAAAVANAVFDALVDFGVELDRLPITPELVWRTLNGTLRTRS
jgi:carbon-monoxide dehydrogenase large subunit